MINPRSLLFALVFFFGTTLGLFGQGINKNIWIFGDCTPSGRTILNFDPIGNEANVIALDPTAVGGRQPLGENTIATAIDQTSGKLLFYSNGALFFDGNHKVGTDPTLAGDQTKPQSVAIAVGSYDQDPLVTDNYFIFYHKAGDLGFQQVQSDQDNKITKVGAANNTFKSNVAAVIELVDQAKPNVSNNSFLFYYDITGGNLHSLNINGTSPSGWLDQSVSLFTPGIVPVSIRFNEASNQVAVVTSTGGIAFVKFDRVSGNFDPATPIRTSLPLSTTAQPKAIAFDPTGTKSYVTIGNQLYQIDLSAPSPNPVLVPGITGVQELFDVQVAPNGKVYFLYTPIGSTEVKLGEIETPSLAATDPGFIVKVDPFPSVNFCGKMFPNFSTTVYITPTVDIILPPLPATGEYCADNPIQLVSKITPANLVPISYQWTVTSAAPATPTSPPSGGPTNFDVAHLILAGMGSATVELVVNFKDQPPVTAASQTVNFSTDSIPEVELNPDPFEVVCPCANPKIPKPSANEGVDLSSWLQVDGSPAPSTGYEYFWSAFPERGWTPNPEAKVCEPGIYYVMVRKVGAFCYGMAEVLLKVVDNDTGDGLEPGRNGKWFFGDKAGIDFNNFPIFPTGPSNGPRPLNANGLGNVVPPITIQNKHPQRIEYGVDVFYDVAGNVIFYSDGEKVWDFGHAPIQIDPTGVLPTLGGDKSASQSTLIIPHPNPNQPTARSLFYIFTSEVNAPYRVKFSMLDLAQGSSSAPGNYLGTVASSNHLLLPDATQQMAGFQEVDKSFVAFKEMGSGRYRVYKIDRDGIHAPKFSESGNFTPSNKIISGALQFSREGKYLASVYSYDDGTGEKSTIEVYNFDKITGDLSLWASFELPGKGHGIEISEDETRLFVSLDNSIREFFIEAQAPPPPGISIPTNPFNTCFIGSSSVLARSLCIKNSSASLSSGNFRALQRGPASANFIFVAVDNQASVSLIDERVGLINRSAVRSPFLPMSLSGRVLKGLPRYNVPIPKSSSLQSPALIGLNEMCLTVNPLPARPPVTGEAKYQLSITGEDLDVHTFRFERDFEGKVTVPTGITTIQSPINPTEWTITFTQPGEYSIYVTVVRCDYTFPELVKKVEIYSPPFILPATINFCDDGSQLEIQALNEDIYYNMSEFDIEWRRADPITLVPFGPIVSTSNKITFTNSITDIGQYVVTAKYNSRLDPCPSSTSVFIGPPRGLDLGIVNSTICFDGTLTAFPYLATIPPTPPTASSGDQGTFKIYKPGGTIPLIEVSNSSLLTLPVKNKLPAGNYELEFEVLDTLARSSSSPVAPKCLLLLRENFTILPEPRIDFVVTNSTNCSTATGEILLQNVNPSFNITVNGLPLASFSPTPIGAGEEKITGLSAGSYLVVVENSGCDFSTNVLVQDASRRIKIPEFSFSVEPIRCNTPFTKGQLTINFPTGFSGNYQIINPFSTPSTVIKGNVLPISKKTVEYLDAGTYKLDFFDANDCFITSFTFDVIDEIGKTTSLTQYFCPLVTPNPTIDLPSFLNLSDPNITGVTWKDSTGLILTPPAGTVFQAPSKGTYSLEVAYGACVMKFEINLLERCSIEYTLPNSLQLSQVKKASSGNSKLQDNVLTLVTSNFVKNVKALVYNRWGQLIHVKEYNSTTPEASKYEIIWDGKVNKQFVPAGTYIVVLFLTDLDDKVEKFTNSVLVLR